MSSFPSRRQALAAFAGTTLERPIITWELPKDAPNDAEELWTTYGKALIAALRFDGDTQN